MNENDQDLVISQLEPQDAQAAPETITARFPVFMQLALLVGLVGVLFLAVSGSPAALITALQEPPRPPAAEEAPLLAETEDGAVPPFEIASDITIGARAAYVWDVVGQRVLYAKSSDTVLPLASITKLMTTLVAYELVSEDTTVRIPGTATSQQSASGLRSGETFSMHNLSALALISSSNDAAYSLGNAVGAALGEGEKMEQFVAAMNIRAEELDLPTLRFYNTTGLDLTVQEAGAYGSAHDVARLLEYIITEYPNLLTVTTEESKRVFNESGEYHDAENTNDYLTRIPNLMASKTGYTDLAGGNLVVAFDAGFNRPVIVTVLGSSRQGRFSDVEKLVKAVMTPPTN